MKQIKIVYFTVDQITMLINMIDRIPSGLVDRIYAGYSATMPSGDHDPDQDPAVIQIWNILQKDIDWYANPLETEIVRRANEIEGSDILKAMIEDHDWCVKHKLIDIISRLMDKVFNSDEVEVFFVGSTDDADISRSFMPRLIRETLQENFECEMQKSDTITENRFIIRKPKKEEAK